MRDIGHGKLEKTNKRCRSGRKKARLNQSVLMDPTTQSGVSMQSKQPRRYRHLVYFKGRREKSQAGGAAPESTAVFPGSERSLIRPSRGEQSFALPSALKGKNRFGPNK